MENTRVCDPNKKKYDFPLRPDNSLCVSNRGIGLGGSVKNGFGDTSPQ